MSAVQEDVAVSGLRVVIAARGHDIVDEISFAIRRGEVLGLVGESGSGKTTVGLAMLNHCRRGAAITQGVVRIGGEDITRLGPQALAARRGSLVAYIPQDPGTALNPAMRLGAQLGEMLSVHRATLDRAAREERIGALLRDVALPDTAEFRQRYPHQVSGGQQQRLAIAMAFACNPRLVVLDEPTTGLDVTTQAHVLRTVRDLCSRHGVAALYVSHDLAVVAELAQRVAVMYAGRLVEEGETAAVFRHPRHPYTQRLLRAMPDPEGRYRPVGIPGHAPAPGHRPPGCFFAPRCDNTTEACDAMPPAAEVVAGHMVRCWHQASPTPPAPPLPASIPARATEQPSVLSLRAVAAHYGPKAVLHDISFAIGPGECLALVGQSGSGKTTLARGIAGLHRHVTGEIRLGAEALAPSIRHRPKEARQRIQYIFQNPYASLNPRRTIGEIIARPLHLFTELDADAIRAETARQLGRVALPARLLDRYPDQLSGGERQRVAIARALAAGPTLLICDEVTSALDVSVQAAVIALLSDLRAEMRLAMLFVTHNLTLVRGFADRVAVMNQGRIVELRETGAVFTNPADAYTRALLADTPGGQAPAAAA